MKLEMRRLKFDVAQDEETGVLTASWDDPNGGGITTQANTLEELPNAIHEAIRCHFLNREVPARPALHFQNDLVLQPA